MILTKEKLIRDGIIMFVASIATSIGMGLILYHFCWGKGPEENIIRFIGYLLVLFGPLLGRSTKSLRKAGIHVDDGLKKGLYFFGSMALYVLATINYFLEGSFTLLNVTLFGIALGFSLALLYFGMRHPQELSEN